MPPTLSLGAGSTPLANQVAGHQCVLSDASGSLVMKPALPREIAFYQLLNSAAKSSILAQLKPFVAHFYGTLRLEGKLDNSGGLTQEGLHVEQVPESVVLENLAHAYTHPSILDVKLGTILHTADATDEKKARMEHQAKTTTTFETGIRLTGCQTWHAPTSTYILTPKSYGKALSPTQLPSGLVRYFPLPSDLVSALVLPLTPPPSSTLNSPTTQDPIPHLPLPSSPDTPTLTPPSSAGLSSTGLSSNLPLKEYAAHAIPTRTMLRVLDIVDEELAKLEAVLSRLEARFVGSSVLILYEGDPTRLDDALHRYDTKNATLLTKPSNSSEPTTSDPNTLTNSPPSPSASSTYSSSTSFSDETSTSSDDDKDDGARADARKARRCPPVTLRLIDFAHTSLVQGEGPDPGVLKGIKTLRGLVQGRREEVKVGMRVEDRDKGIKGE